MILGFLTLEPPDKVEPKNPPREVGETRKKIEDLYVRGQNQGAGCVFEVSNTLGYIGRG